MPCACTICTSVPRVQYCTCTRQGFAHARCQTIQGCMQLPGLLTWSGQMCEISCWKSTPHCVAAILWACRSMEHYQEAFCVPFRTQGSKPCSFRFPSDFCFWKKESPWEKMSRAEHVSRSVRSSSNLTAPIKHLKVKHTKIRTIATNTAVYAIYRWDFQHHIGDLDVPIHLEIRCATNWNGN